MSRLRQGDNFDILIDDYCDEPLKSQGGLLGKFARGALIPPERQGFLDESGRDKRPGMG